MKRLFSALLIICLIVFCFSGCGKTGEKGEKISIVCTAFPVYDWICEILGDDNTGFDIQLLGKSGMDMHSFQPSVQDISTILESDLFVYVGGISDAWADDVIKNSKNNIESVKILDILATETQGTQHVHDGHDAEADEHIWMSLRFASKVIEILTNKIVSLNSEHENEYRNNSKNYLSELAMLDEQYKNAVSESKDKTIIVADRFPFLYLANDYGIKYFAAFPGCSADSEVSFETVIKLAEAVDDCSKKTILITENSINNIAESVIDSTKTQSANTAVINSFQSVSDYEKGYLEIMKENLVSLKMALE